MILLIGEIQMMIKKIAIQNLHDEYDYEIEFDPQLTFLFGSNGCGKTTILNMLASIVTGKLYNLVDYVFDKVQLDYMGGNKKYEKIEIIIEKLGKDIRNIQIAFVV